MTGSSPAACSRSRDQRPLRLSLLTAAALATLIGPAVCGLAQDRRLVPVGQAAGGQAAGGRRVALVIGNDTYAKAPLVNARNDARTIAAALRALPEPFAVTTVEDATQGQMAAAIGTFVEGLRATDLAVFFYAGHGVQVDQENYLVPVDYAGTSVLEAKLRMIPASSVAGALRTAGVAVLVLDACRDNPFRGARAAGGGLGSMEARGTLIAYATGAGQTASDNPGGGNGLFTQELVAALQEPGLTVSDVFRRVRTRVRAATNERQWPAVYDDLVGDVVLRPAAPATPPPAQPDPDLARREELAFWESIKDSSEVGLFEEYLRTYPSGPYVIVARSRIAALSRPADKPPAPPPAAPPPVSASGPGGRIAEAEALMQRQVPDYNRAIRLFRAVLALEPSNPRAAAGLARAEAALAEAETLGLVAEAEALLMREVPNYERAIRLFKAVLAVDPGNRRALDGLGRAERAKSARR